MSKFEKWSFGILTALVSVSGLLYLWMKYFITGADPFSVVNHPLQPWMLQVHLLAAPPLVFVLGMILQSHILRKIKSRYRPNRRTGLVTLGTFAIMTLSGYLLQILVDPTLTRVAMLVHVGSGSVFAITYVVHLVISVRLVARYPAVQTVVAVTASNSR